MLYVCICVCVVHVHVHVCSVYFKVQHMYNFTIVPLTFMFCGCGSLYFIQQNPDRRTQLWRMTAEGQLVHIASSETSGVTMVLDVAGSRLPGAREHTVPLVVRRHSSSRSNLQTWKFSDVSVVFFSRPAGVIDNFMISSYMYNVLWISCHAVVLI